MKGINNRGTGWRGDDEAAPRRIKGSTEWVLGERVKVRGGNEGRSERARERQRRNEIRKEEYRRERKRNKERRE